MTQKKYFGTDGVRGRVGGSIINVETMIKLGFAIGSIIKSDSQKKSTILIGRDTRESGELLQSALQAGLISVGVDVYLLGVLSTPAIAFLTQKLNAAAGIVISASHNLYEDNGVKIIGRDGFKLSDESEIQIEKKITACQINSKDVKTGVSENIADASAQYISHCLQLFQDLNLKNKKLILDCANGATFNCAPTIFSELGANVIAIHAHPNGTNINDHCGATDVSSLQARVITEKADCGIAFDGDGDRLIMIDERGEVVDGDEILCILALDETKKYKAIVGTLMSNVGLEKKLQSCGIQFERAAVGDRYVLEKLLNNHWQLGGEGSGHIVNLEYATTGDGVLTALQVLRIMQHTQKSLHTLKRVMKKRPQILLNVKVKDPNRFSEMPKITNAVRDAEKKLNGTGRVLLRASGTESCVRVMVECDALSQAESIAEELANTVSVCFKTK
ncbi:MAG: phosphoglucosamine mutase [Gammaproteobacteria bacterium RIFCSPHIGHO2_02_FULL_39_13]|nr:MAG: phosphoglucosamine mutase [Gammaproteobacteria bacterium RIFCSPHIGHO2_02_FULL_39_13]OGT49604.1 MAG: phosphoglucosamine mutase [Gammaproteobacteria bacterium RIFCSPHIGHO2_12_FULL_39_24]